VKARSRRPLALALGLAVCLVALAGCAGGPSPGPITRPEPYPSARSPEEAFATFLWAWKRGDLDVLEGYLGAWLRQELKEKLETEDRAAVSAWYREGAEHLELREIDWTHRGDSLAYVRVVLAGGGLSPTALDFSLLRRPDGWVVSGKRLLR